MATDHENRVAGADQYERGSSLPRSFARRSARVPLPAVASPPLRGVSEGDPSRAYTPLRAQKSGPCTRRARKYVRGTLKKKRRGGGMEREREAAIAKRMRRARIRARIKNEGGFLAGRRNATRNDTCFRDASGPRRTTSARRKTYLFPYPANRLSPSLYLAIIDSLPRESFGRALSPLSRVSAPPISVLRTPNFAQQHLVILRYLLLSIISLSSLLSSFSRCHLVAVVSVSHAKPSTVRAVSPRASLRLSWFHTAVTSANVHCYHATALAPPPGTEGEINESKVRRSRS